MLNAQGEDTLLIPSTFSFRFDAYGTKLEFKVFAEKISFG